MENTQNANVNGKKLPYEKPEVEVIELDQTPQLLSGSNRAARPDYESQDW